MSAHAMSRFFLVVYAGLFLVAGKGIAASTSEPVSDLAQDKRSGLSLQFCADHDPEFAFRGGQCCSSDALPKHGRRVRNVCDPKRSKGHFCDEVTDEQKKYLKDVESGAISDVPAYLSKLVAASQDQSFCGVNNGFLVNGTPLAETAQNRIRIRAPGRCTQYGSAPLVAMVDWLGRQVNEKYSDPKYSKLRMVVGDMAAPKGGCMSGRSGRRGHASHTNGLDVDLSFLWPKANQSPPEGFHQNFDPETAWWTLKTVFKNPFVCVKVVFLDRKLIGKLARVAGSDPEWAQYRTFIRHVKFHKNHFHIRVGDRPGVPGCNANPEDEIEEEEGDGPHPFNLLESLGIGS